MITTLLLATLVVGANAFGFAPPRDHLNQNASYTCFKSGDNCTLIFFLETTDNPDLLYLEHPDNASMRTDGVYDSDGNGIEGDGSEASPYKIVITMDCSDPSTLTLLWPADAIVKVTDPDVFEIQVMVKSVYAAPVYGGLVYIDDTRYNPRCNCSESEFSTVTQSLLIIGDINEEVAAISESSEIAMGWGFLVPTTFAPIGEDVYYILTMNPDNAASGAFVFNCYICDVATCDGADTYLIIDDNGCGAVPGISGFKMNGGQLRTDTFQAFQLANQLNLFLSCSVGYCYDPTDPRCQDYCASNQGRKKRQADDTDDKVEQIKAAFTIVVNKDRPSSRSRVEVNDGPINASPPPVTNSQYVGLMAAVITLSALLLIGLIVVIVVFLHMSKRSSGAAGKA